MARSLLIVSVLFCALLTAACPGEIPDPGAFLNPVPDSGCDAPGTVFMTICAECHHAPPGQLGELDLNSPNVESRLVGVGSAACGSQNILVVAGQPDASYLYQKITSPTPACGAQMPQVGTLTPAQIQCVATWITALAPSGADGGT
jgi:hypothetical protein